MNLIRLKRDPQSMIHMRVDRVFRLVSLKEELICKDPSTPSEILRRNKELSRISKKLTWYKISLYRQVWMNMALIKMPKGANTQAVLVRRLVKKSVTRNMAADYTETGITLEDGCGVDVLKSLVYSTIDKVMNEVPDIPTQD